MGFFVLSYTRTHTFFSSFLFGHSTVLFSKQIQTTLLSNVSALGWHKHCEYQPYVLYEYILGWVGYLSIRLSVIYPSRPCVECMPVLPRVGSYSALVCSSAYRPTYRIYYTLQSIGSAECMYHTVRTLRYSTGTDTWQTTHHKTKP